MSPSRLALPVLSGLSLTALAACAWSVPADPGENARLRSAPPAWSVETPVPRSGPGPAAPGIGPRAAPAARPASDDGARAVYLARCSACHEPFAPTHVSASQWPFYVAKYGPRAGLFGDERARVLAWLQAHSR